jgi:hypothetical protein
MNRISIWVLAAALGACAGAKTTEKGPKLSAELTCGSTRVQDEDQAQPPKDCKADTDKHGYEINLSISLSDGDKMTEGANTKPEYFPGSEPKVTIDVGGQPLPAPKLTSRDFFQGKSYEADPFVIPDTSKGKTLQVKVESSDERGLKANIVDLKIALN